MTAQEMLKRLEIFLEVEQYTIKSEVDLGYDDSQDVVSVEDLQEFIDTIKGELKCV